jgi:HSP20 family protein
VAIRLDPVAEMSDMARAVSRLLNDPGNAEGVAYTIPVDLYETSDDVYVIAQLPGIAKDAVTVEVIGNTLVFTANRPLPAGGEAQFLHIETLYGRFERRITLSSAVETERVSASWHDGMLTVRLPKASAAKPRRIPIGDGSAEPQLALAGSGDAINAG